MPDGVLIQCVAEGLSVRPLHEGDVVGAYLQTWDLEFADGVGAAVWTDDIAEAHVFADMTEAFDIYRSSPACRPFREDGKPNRPLAAYTVEFVRQRDAGDSPSP